MPMLRSGEVAPLIQLTKPAVRRVLATHGESGPVELAEYAAAAGATVLFTAPTEDPHASR